MRAKSWKPGHCGAAPAVLINPCHTTGGAGCRRTLWRPMPENEAAFTLLTTAPGPDVAPIHDRQMVILNRDDWAAWLDQTRPEAELLQPLPTGSLRVEQVRP
jgi:putative SOS response-associated peptidase YedK